MAGRRRPLPDLPAELRRLRRGRHRRLRRNRGKARPSGLAGRQHRLVQPVFRVAVRRRGVRRQRLLLGRPALRHQRRPRQTDRRGRAARHPGAPRSGGRTHLGPAPLVHRLGGRPLRPPLHLGRHGPAAGGVRRLPGRPPRLLPAELLRVAARPQLRLRAREPRRALAAARRRRGPARQPAGPVRRHGPLAVAGPVRLPGGHGRLARQGRPGPRGDGPALARTARPARRRAPRGGAALRMG